MSKSNEEGAPRGPRWSDAQKSNLIIYMHCNRGFARRKCGADPDTATDNMINRQWVELAEALNILGPAKTVIQWQKAWTDTKQRVKAKADALRVQRNQTGNFPNKIKDLDFLEMKVLDVIGPATVEGIPGTMESMPESQAMVQQLMIGNRGAVNEDKPLSLFQKCGLRETEKTMNRGSVPGQHSQQPITTLVDDDDTDPGQECQHGSAVNLPDTGPSTSGVPMGLSSSAVKRKGEFTTSGMTKRMAVEERTAQFASMQEKQVETLSTMAKAQMLAAQTQARQVDQQELMIDEYRKMRVEFQKLTSCLEKIVQHMSKE